MTTEVTVNVAETGQRYVVNVASEADADNLERLLAKLKANTSHMTDRAMLQAVLTSWHAVFGSKPMALAAAFDHATMGLDDAARSVLRDALMVKSNGASARQAPFNTRRVGHCIAQRERRIVEGLSFHRELGGRGSAQAWEVRMSSSNGSRDLGDALTSVDDGLDQLLND